MKRANTYPNSTGSKKKVIAELALMRPTMAERGNYTPYQKRSNHRVSSVKLLAGRLEKAGILGKPRITTSKQHTLC